MNGGIRVIASAFIIFSSCADCLSEWELVESDINLIPEKDLYYSALTFLSPETGWLQGMNAVFHTENGGENWERISQKATFSASFSNQSISFVDIEHGWILHADSLYATTDGGHRWTATHLPTSEFQRIHFQSILHGVACTANGFYYTIDGGKTWNGSGITGLADGPLAITNFHFNSTASGLATAWGPGIGNGVIFRTADGGESWEVIKTGYEYNAVWCINQMHIVVVGVDERYRCGVIDVTFDGGATWKDTLVDPFLDDVAFCDTMYGTAVAGDTLLIETHDGGMTWQKIEDIGHESSISVSATGNTLYILTTKGDLYRNDRSTRTLISPARWEIKPREFGRYASVNHDGIARLSPVFVNLAGRKTGDHSNACGVFIKKNAFSQLTDR